MFKQGDIVKLVKFRGCSPWGFLKKAGTHPLYGEIGLFYKHQSFGIIIDPSPHELKNSPEVLFQDKLWYVRNFFLKKVYSA